MANENLFSNNVMWLALSHINFPSVSFLYYIQNVNMILFSCLALANVSLKYKIPNSTIYSTNDFYELQKVHFFQVSNTSNSSINKLWKQYHSHDFLYFLRLHFPERWIIRFLLSLSVNPSRHLLCSRAYCLRLLSQELDCLGSNFDSTFFFSDLVLEIVQPFWV